MGLSFGHPGPLLSTHRRVQSSHEFDPGSPRDSRYRAGRNMVCLNTACLAVMSYDSRATRNVSPFLNGDNGIPLAESAGRERIETAGLPLMQARIDFGPGPVGKKVFSS